MKIAYIIAAHRNPEQLARLIDRLDDEGISFLIHINKKEEEMYQASYERLAGRENVHFVTRVPVRWSGFGLVRGFLMGIQAICESGLNVDYAINLSGQDYPIKPNRVIKQRLAEYEGRTILESFPLPYESWQGNGGLFRIEPYYFRILGKYYSYPPAKMRWLPHKKREVPHGLKPYGGSAWWCFNPETLTYVNDFVQTKVGRDVIRFFEHAWGSPELFFQTVLVNSLLADDIVNDNLWQIDWIPGVARPVLFTSKHFESLRDSDGLFARKFDPAIDAEILDLIDENILSVDGGGE
jgi:hypothetical protein